MTLQTDCIQGIYLTTEQMAQFHRHCRAHPDSEPARTLTAKGDDALARGPFSVVDKGLTPPSGDKHDFLRRPTYAWPNPDTPDGLPYITRDGEPGPGIHGPDYDMGRLREFTTAVGNLAWAALATGKDAYAEHAVGLLRAWFLDPATRMNPNLTYAKHTPGDEPPYPTGVIATHNWVTLVQAITILAGTPAWSPPLQQGLYAWFRDYLQWLQTSPQGRAERAFDNNRGTWYEAQLAAFSCFVGDDDRARHVLREHCPPRLDRQIAADGSLPHELRRTNSLGYTLMTLKAWVMLALMGDQLGVDLWRRTTADGRGLRLALDFTSPYISQPDTWPHQQIKPPPVDRAILPWFAAARAYNDDTLYQALAALDPKALQRERATLLFPRA